MNRPAPGRRSLALVKLLTVVVLVGLAPVVAGVGSPAGTSDAAASGPPPSAANAADSGEPARLGRSLEFADTGSGPTDAGPSEAPPETHTLRLLTGQTFAIAEGPDGLRQRPLAGGPVSLVETADRRYLLPAGVDLSTYDPSLFDVRSLIERGLEAGAPIPVLLETDAPPNELSGPGLRNVRRLDSAGVVAAEVEPGVGSRTVEALVNDGTVDRVTLDRAVGPTAPGGTVPTVGANHTRLTGEGVTVAVLDTGIDSTHPALAGRVVDRVDFVGANGSTLDPHGHGTHVAGVLAGDDGVAPGASLVDVTVMGRDGRGRTSTVIEGVEYAVEQADADVVLLSLGSSFDGSPALAEAVAWAADQGVVVVAAVGNNGYPRSIGAAGRPSGVITVGATSRRGRVARYSARGPTLDGRLKPDLVAPGDRIEGPRPSASDRRSTGDGRYIRRSGTSSAAAQVAGAAALLLEADPNRSARHIENRLASTARPVPDAGPYASGGGELALDRALDPAVVAEDAVVDFGLVESNGTRTRTVSIENRDDRRHDLAFELAVTRGGRVVDAVATVNRSELSLAPGERASVALTVNGSVEPGTYGGELRYTVDGEPRTVAFGFVRGGTVTVEKRPLTRASSVQGDALWVLTEERTHDQVVEFENGTASFVAGGGAYVLWSSGTDEATGTTVLLSERRRFDGPTTVELDERDTVPVGVNASPLVERYGPLRNLSVVASMSAPSVEGTPKLSVAQRTAASRRVRVSRDPQLDVATTFLLAPGVGGGPPLDAPDVFHLAHGQRGVDGPSVVVARPESLITTEHRYHRTAVDESVRIQDRAAIDGVWNYRPLTWFDLGGRTLQRIHRLPTAGTYSRSVDGGAWRARRTLEGATESPTDVVAHPLFGLVEGLRLAGGNASVTVVPFADGSGTAVDPPGEHRLTASVNGARVRERRIEDGTATVGGLPLEPGDDLTLRLSGNNTDARLSTRTVTEVRVAGYDRDTGIDPSRANQPPLVRNVEVVNATAYNAVEPGSVRVALDVDRLRSLARSTVWYATGDPQAPPWEDRAGWHRVEPHPFDGRLVATLDVNDSVETVSLAAQLRTVRGHSVRTMTTDAFYVGEAPNTSTSMVLGRLVTENGTPAANGTVIVQPVDGDSMRVIETDDAGRFSVEVPRNRSYDLAYVNGAPWSPRASVGADRPSWHALRRVYVGDDVALGNRTLPPGHPLDIRVVDERGEPVANATVRITHAAGPGQETAALSGRLETNADGLAVANRTDGPGVGLAGRLRVEITPPDDPMYPEQTLRFNVTHHESGVYNRTLETAPPAARLTASGRFQPGYLVTLWARESTVPAGVAEYRWDLDGDGTADRITGANNSTIRYDPEEWGRSPVLTVVDAAGKTDRSRVVIPERATGTSTNGTR